MTERASSPEGAVWTEFARRYVPSWRAGCLPAST
jgi:hypothetical protein